MTYFAGDKAKELPRQQRRGGSSTQIVRARDVKKSLHEQEISKRISEELFPSAFRKYLKYQKRYRRSSSNILNSSTSFVWHPHTISESFHRMEVMFIFGVKPRTQKKLIKCISVFVING